MHANPVQTHPFSRHPLSAFGKLAVAALTIGAAASGVLALAIGFPDNIRVLVITLALLAAAGLASTGLRWMPPLLAVMSGLFLFELLRAPYVDYHLSNPKAGGFFPFVMDLLIAASALITFGASIGAAIENYRQESLQAPGTRLAVVTAWVAGVAGILMGAILIAAIAQSPAPAYTTDTNGVPSVHMNADRFTRPSVAIARGANLLLVDDVSVPHILANGSWENGTARPVDEAGAPSLKDVRVAGDRVSIGPFTTAGTYHIYCTVHRGMNLTVNVQ